MKRDVSVDIAKGLGIILVVWGHTFDACPISNWIFLFHMPLFFFVAGFFMKKEEGDAVFFYKKVRTLLIPFLFFYGCSVVIKGLLKYHSTGDWHFITLPKFYALSNINYPLWFIICLFFTVIIFHFLYKLKYSYIGFILLAIIGAALFRYQISLPLYLSQAFVVSLLLYIGKLCYSTKNKIKTLLILLFITLPFFIYSGITKVKIDLRGLTINCNFILFLLSSLGGISLTCLLSILLAKTKLSGVMSTLGRYSLFIFGLHANNRFLDPLAIKLTNIFSSIPSQFIHENIGFGIIKTIICVLFFLAVGIILKKIFPFFFGYSLDDKILEKLQKSKTSILK